MTDYIAFLMNELNFPDKSKRILIKTYNKIKRYKSFDSDFSTICSSYMAKQDADINKAVSAIETLALRWFVHPYTLDLLFVMECSETTLGRYLKKGYTMEFFLSGAKDFRYKLIECEKRTGITGTFVATWNDNFLKMRRFTLGRFQYEYAVSEVDFTAKCGYEIHMGDPIINLHIPWSGVSLKDSVRMSSYKQAYEFYKNELNGKPLVLVCHSWLIYPRQKEFLDENSNVLKFLNDFEIYECSQSKHNGPGWRLYGKDYPKMLLPERNSLEKAYSQWLKKGNPGGHGSGFIIFDGKNILTSGDDN